MRRALLGLVAALTAGLLAPPAGSAPPKPAAARPAPAAPAGFSAAPLVLPNPVMIDEKGRKVRFRDDLVAGRTVAVAFMFTGCSTTCPVTAQTLRATQALLPDRFATDMRIIAVSVDPAGDTPARVGDYMRKLGAPAGFTFVTGNPAGSDAIQRTLTGSAARGAAHTASIFIIGRDGRWTRLAVAGNTPRTIARRMVQASELGLTRAQVSGRYFTNLPVIDQQGRERRFYRDVVQGRTVVINTLFTRCADACPVITARLARARALLGEQPGVSFVSISSDVTFDDPARLRAFAQKMSLPAQWTLLTGKRDNLAWLLQRLGLGSEDPAGHPTQVLVVNERTLDLRRLSPSATPRQMAEAIRAVASQQPSAT